MEKLKLNKNEILKSILNAKETNYLTHNFHPYPAKFIPQTPNLIINLFTKPSEIIFDPFCGSGTALVEAKLLNRNAIGVDLHPIAVLMSKVKTTKILDKEITTILDLLKKIEKRIGVFYKKYRRKETLYGFVEVKLKDVDFSYSIPDFPNKAHWFQNHVQHELAIIKTSIQQANISQQLKDFLFLAFSCIIVPVSNQESETRYAAIKKKIPPKQTFYLFKNKVIEMFKRIKEFSKIASDSHIEVFQADSKFLDFIKDNMADLIITSPPYPNTYDYYLYHKFRMYWLDYDVKKVQIKEIGSREKHSSKKETIESYIKDMNDCFKHFTRILKPDKYFVIVIGDSIIGGKLSKGDKVIKSITKNIGFEFVDKIDYNLGLASKSFNPAFRSKIKEEHIIFLKNEK